MIKTINLGEREESIKALEILKGDEGANRDIQITNSHIMELNQLVKRKIFRNSLLYIDSQTLYDIMQPTGESDSSHNYHELNPEDVYMALTSIKDPQYVFIAKYHNRHATISVELSHFKLPLMIVIETKAKIISNWEVVANKVVTIYPKDHIDAYIEKLDQRLLLYKKENESR